MNLHEKLAKYPKWGEWRNKPDQSKNNNGKRCIYCEMVTNGRRYMQVSFFRGDDELVSVCLACKNKPINEIPEKK